MHSIIAVGAVIFAAKDLKDHVGIMSVVLNPNIFHFIIRKPWHDFVEARTEIINSCLFFLMLVAISKKLESFLELLTPVMCVKSNSIYIRFRSCNVSCILYAIFNFHFNGVNWSSVSLYLQREVKLFLAVLLSLVLFFFFLNHTFRGV